MFIPDCQGRRPDARNRPFSSVLCGFIEILTHLSIKTTNETGPNRQVGPSVQHQRKDSMPGPAVPEYSSAFQSDLSTPAHAFPPIPYTGIRVHAIEEANQGHEHAFPPIPYTEIRSEQRCFSLTLKLIMGLKHIPRIPVGPQRSEAERVSILRGHRRLSARVPHRISRVKTCRHSKNYIERIKHGGF